MILPATCFRRASSWSRMKKSVPTSHGKIQRSGATHTHDTSGGGEDDVAKLTGREELDNPLLELAEADVVAGADDTNLVEAGEPLASRASISAFYVVRNTHRPLSWTTILPDRWSSTCSNSPM